MMLKGHVSRQSIEILLPVKGEPVFVRRTTLLGLVKAQTICLVKVGKERLGKPFTLICLHFPFSSTRAADAAG